MKIAGGAVAPVGQITAKHTFSSIFIGIHIVDRCIQNVNTIQAAVLLAAAVLRTVSSRICRAHVGATLNFV